MTNFETHSAEEINRPSYEEIQDFAIHLKVRFGDQAATTADYFVQEHEEAGDILRAQMWRTVSSSIKANDFASNCGANRVNARH